MKYLLFIIFTLFSSYLFSQDIKEIEQLLRQSLQSNGAVYKGLKFAINFERNDGDWNINTKLDKVLDEGILERIKIDLTAQAKNISFSKLKAYVKYDDYSPNIFVNLIDRSVGEELFDPIILRAEPRDGIISFVNRWYLHLDSCIDWSTHNQVANVSFIVEKTGELVPLRTNVFHEVLTSFLKDEKNWFQDILSGRPTKTKITLLIPANRSAISSIVIKSNEKTLYQINLESYKQIVTQDMCSFWSDVVYVSDKPITRSGLNVVSFVLENGNYVSPISHQGNLNDCRDLIKEVSAKSYKYFFNGYGVNQFDRVYFYSENLK